MNRKVKKTQKSKVKNQRSKIKTTIQNLKPEKTTILFINFKFRMFYCSGIRSIFKIRCSIFDIQLINHFLVSMYLRSPHPILWHAGSGA
jgi:hypothetical protein